MDKDTLPTSAADAPKDGHEASLEYLLDALNEHASISFPDREPRSLTIDSITEWSVPTYDTQYFEFVGEAEDLDHWPGELAADRSPSWSSSGSTLVEGGVSLIDNLEVQSFTEGGNFAMIMDDTAQADNQGTGLNIDAAMDNADGSGHEVIHQENTGGTSVHGGVSEDNNRGSDCNADVSGHNCPAQRQIGVVEALLAYKQAILEHKTRDLDELKVDYKELKQELKDAKQECKDIKQEYKDSKQEYQDVKQECKEVKQELKDAKQERQLAKDIAKQEYEAVREDLVLAKDEHQSTKKQHEQSQKELQERIQQGKKKFDDLMDDHRELNGQFRRNNDDRRLLQARNLVLLNEILLLQGDVRFVLHNPGKPLPPHGDQSGNQTPGVSTPTSGQTRASLPADDIDITPTPSKAVLAEVSKATPVLNSEKSNMSLAHASDVAIKSPVIVSSPSSAHFGSKANTAFNQGVGFHGSLSTRSSNPALHERTSFYQQGRVDDPFQQSPSQTSPSKQPSAGSLTLSRESSFESFHGTPSKTTKGRTSSTTKALMSTNWRSGSASASVSADEQPANQESAETEGLQHARSQYALLLSKIETWADVYCGTIHTSVRSKEQRTSEMIKVLSTLVGNFDPERVFTKLDFRTMLVAAHVNRRLLERLFGDDIITDHFGAETVSRLRELNAIAASTPGHEPARQQELATEKAEILAAAFAVPGAWRTAEAKSASADVCGLLNPIIPISERAGAVMQMEALVEEALQVVGSLRGSPARAWHMAFDLAGSRVNPATMSVRGTVEGRAGPVGSAASPVAVEEDHIVVLSITPHLVTNLWTQGGVVSEELLKADVLSHTVGKGFFTQHR